MQSESSQLKSTANSLLTNQPLKRILIVEDEAIIAMELGSYIRELGYKLAGMMNSGEKAIKQVKQEKPDLLIMDIRLKGDLDGIETAAIIRKEFDLPIIFSTAHLDQEKIDKAKLTIPFGFILKPIRRKDLKVTIEMALYMSEINQQRKRAELALKQSEEKHRALFLSMRLGVVYQDQEGKIIDANPAAEKILGITLDQMTGRTSMDRRWKAIKKDGTDCPGDQHPAMLALRQGKPVYNFIMGVQHAEQEAIRWIKIDSVPKFRNGEQQPFEVYSLFEDVTGVLDENGTLTLDDE